MTGNNQVWKFNPTASSFTPDTTFGNAGEVAGFNVPFDVAVSPDGGTLSVSDSGNNQIQQFSSTTGAYISSFGTSGSAVGQFNAPKGLAYDSIGYLYIVDSGNNRVALALSGTVISAGGTTGPGFGQLQSPVNLGVGSRGVYVADTGNNRVQSFSAITSGGGGMATPFDFRLAISTELGLSQPNAVAPVDDLLTEKIYIADTSNNRIILVTIPNSEPDELQAVWNNMVSHVNSGDFVGAGSYFSVASSDNYLQVFQAVGSANAISAINEAGTLNPVYIYDNRAEYYFTSTGIISGQTIGFPVEFDKENGIWKILEF